MAKRKEDKSGNIIGDGTFHVDYTVYEFPDYPQIKSSVSKSSTTESVYVTYTNTENLESITVRFSWHENNAVKFGDQLHGDFATKNEILYRLKLLKKTHIPIFKKYIQGRPIKKSEIKNYEIADKTIQELYELNVGDDISIYKGKISKNGNYLLTGNKIYQQEVGRTAKYVPIGTVTIEDEIREKESKLTEKRNLFLKNNPLPEGYKFSSNDRTYINFESFRSNEKILLFQKDLGGGAFEYHWISKSPFGKNYTSKEYIDFLINNANKYIAFLETQNQSSNITALTTQFQTMLQEELKACSKGIYPKVCSLRDSERGFELIFKNVYDIVSQTGMSIGSALAQYESTL
jgi:hypothetical protein